MKIRFRAQHTHHPCPTDLPPFDLSNKPDFPRNPPRRRPNESFRRSRGLDTPLFDEFNTVDGKSFAESGWETGRQVISVRKLAANLWRLHSTEIQISGSFRLGLQPGDAVVGDASIYTHHAHNYDSVSKNGFHHKFEPSIKFSNSAMDGATKWDHVNSALSNELNQLFSVTMLTNQQLSNVPVISALGTQIKQTNAKVNKLEIERRSLKEKLELLLHKLGDQTATWRSKEHEKFRAIIHDMKAALSREKKNSRRLEIVNSKLVNELSDAKKMVKRSLQEYEMERKAREMMEEVCDELAKEIREDRAEVDTLKRDSRRHWEEVEEERKMLQTVEVWLEEQVQMKLVNAKVLLEQKYFQMNRIVVDLEAFLNSRRRDTEEIHKAHATELTSEPPNPNDMFSIFTEPTSHSTKISSSTPNFKLLNENNIERRSNDDMDCSSKLNEGASEWEIVSHSDNDQGSSCSAGESDPSVSKSVWVSNESRDLVEEVDSVQPRQLKRASSSISRLWRSCSSNGVKGIGYLNSTGEWSSPELVSPNPAHGCIEWPRSAQKSSLKARLSEARMESRKVQLRQVLKQKV